MIVFLLRDRFNNNNNSDDNENKINNKRLKKAFI